MMVKTQDDSGLDERIDAAAKLIPDRVTVACEHEWIDIRNSVVQSGSMCGKCRMRFKAWPGTIHYDEIVAARDLQKPDRK